MKTLPDILRDAMLLLEDDSYGRENVVIARGHAHELLDDRSRAFQIRLQPDDVDGYGFVGGFVGETRAWLGAQWSEWRIQQGWLGGIGFDIADVLAADWRIVS